MSYIDDLLGAELPSKAKNSFDCMVKLLKDLHIPISMSKLTPPTTKMTCLGIEVDSVEATLSIPPPKFTEILQDCVELNKRTRFTKRQLQRIIGKLMFINKVVKLARIFVNRLLNQLRNMGAYANMSTEVKKDINWFCAFVEKFNGTCQYIHTPLIDMETIEFDACLTGIGACYNNMEKCQSYSVLHT